MRIVRIGLLTLAGFLCACSNQPPADAPVRTESTAPEPRQGSQDPQFVGGTETGRFIVLGKAIDPDNTIQSPGDTFDKTDTIYVSVNLGSGANTSNTGTLKARWSYLKGSEVVPVKEESRTLTPTTTAVSEFHVNDSQGLAAGNYQVELLLDDRLVGVRTFRVQ